METIRANYFREEPRVLSLLSAEEGGINNIITEAVNQVCPGSKSID